MFSYETKGVCSKQISFEVTDGIVRKAAFIGGCNGNAQGISALIEGMDAEDVIKKLKGLKCSNKTTSCPDQLALALENALKIKNDNRREL